MKNALTAILLLICSASWAQSISITIDQIVNPKENLAKYNFENYLIQNLVTYKIDTVKAVNGKINIPNRTNMITPFALARMQPRTAMIFYVEPKQNFTLNVVEPNFGIRSSKGSQAQADYIHFLQKQEKLQKESQRLQKSLAQISNETSLDSLRKRVDYLQMEMNAQYETFIYEQRDNNLGGYLVFDIANKNQRISSEALQGLYSKLSDQGKSTHFGKQVGNRIKRLTAMDIGNIAPNFTLQNAQGKKYTLSDLRGKYVLIDFWASWCGPCVREIPHLKKAYTKYRKKGFEIMSVSIDRKKSQWLKAVDKYKMPWISVIDNIKNEDKITQTLYYVPTIPRTVLLDTHGKVIGKDFRGASLEKQLEEIFTN